MRLQHNSTRTKNSKFLQHFLESQFADYLHSHNDWLAEIENVRVYIRKEPQRGGGKGGCISSRASQNIRKRRS